MLTCAPVLVRHKSYLSPDSWRLTLTPTQHIRQNSKAEKANCVRHDLSVKLQLNHLEGTTSQGRNTKCKHANDVAARSGLHCLTRTKHSLLT